MPDQRLCDMCLQPYLGRGSRADCSQLCPSRLGARRGYVVDELAAGRIVPGLHPQSPLILQARRRVMRRADSNNADLAVLREQILELVRRREDLEEEQALEAWILARLHQYRTRGHDANQRGTSSQPEPEPQG